MNDKYTIYNESNTTYGFARTAFADLPDFGIWADRPETDEELLEEMGRGWQGFGELDE